MGRVSLMKREFLVCRNVCKTYQGARVLKGVTMSVSRGEVVVPDGAEWLWEEHIASTDHAP